MSVSDLSSLSGSSMSGQSMNAVSGASPYMPSASSSGNDATVAQMRSNIQQNSQDFKALKNALGSNDLSGATQAYATLQSDIQNASASAGGQSPFSTNSPIGKDFQAIGSALSSGDLQGAQSAFATFKQDLKKAGRVARSQSASVGGTDSDGDNDSGASDVNSTSSTGSTTDGSLNVYA